MQIDEPIDLSQYDPIWPTRFVLEKQSILNVLSSEIKAIEHFGSTAVPGLVAKPIIDILVGINCVPVSTRLIRVLETLQYEYLGEAGIPGRFYFRKRREQAFNVAAVEWGERLWKDNLLLRDFLRSNPELAGRYADLKKAIISTGNTDLLGYSARKDAFMTTLLEQARKVEN